MTLLAAWSILKRFWWAIPLAGLLLYSTLEHRSATRWKAKQTATQAAFDTTVANYRTASAKAIADNIADVRAKEGDAAQITEKAQNDLQAQLADARALAADYARRMRAASAAYPGSADKTSSGETPGTPGGPDNAGMSLVADSDVRICTENTVKVKGWADWYAELRARYNAETP